MASPSLTLLPNARVQFLDADGNPYVGGTVGYYIPGTLTAKDTWQDAFQTTANANPLTLDDLGSAAVWGTGFYRQIVKDVDGNTVWDGNTVAPQLGAGSGELFLPNVAAAVAAVIAAGTPSISILGYYIAGDGGGGVYIHAPAGAGPGKFQSADGQWWELGTISNSVGAIKPEQLGAKGDGSNDSAAFASLIALGRPIVGTPGVIYGLNDPLIFSSVPHFYLQDITLKDLNPNSTNRVFLYGSGNVYVQMSNVKVLRNGSGAGGSFQGAAAIWLDTVTYLDLNSVEVSGNNAGVGINLVGCLGGTVDRAYIHDMTAGTSATPNPGDGADQIAGIWVNNCIGVTINSANCRNLLTQCVDYAPQNINTRGITGGGPGSAVALTNCLVNNCDEGYDLSGDSNMVGWEVTACRAENCRKFGFKAAVSARFGNFVNCYAYRCTLDGFYIQGSNQTLSDQGLNTRGIKLIGCVAHNTGYNVGTYYPGFDTTGFRVDVGGAYPTWPRAVWFINCHTFGGSDMKVAYRNSIGTGYTNGDMNRLVNCTASDFTQAAQQGFVDNWSLLGLSADQAVGNNSDTQITWSHVLNATDGFGFLTGGANPGLSFNQPCRAEISINVAWNQASNGNRSAWAVVNGSRVPGQRDIRTTNTVSESTNNLTFSWTFAAGDVLEVFVNQDSGSTITVNGSDTTISVVDLDSPTSLVVVV